MTRNITIILPDTLQSTGLQSMLIDYFNPVEVSYYSSFATFSAEGNDATDYLFTDTETFVMHADYFMPRKNKTIVLIKDIPGALSASSPFYIQVNAPQETILNQLKLVFQSESIHTMETNKELSTREIDVLSLIVKGFTNKEIAEKLNISLNTVLTHRKNITSKLGIKTVSGLTYYAIMNSYISAEDIEL